MTSNENEKARIETLARIINKIRIALNESYMVTHMGVFSQGRE